MTSKQPPPDWVTTTPGVPEAFKPLDKAEAEKLALAAIAEAQAFTESPAANLASDSMRFLADAERRRITTEAQLALEPLFKERRRKFKELVIQYVRALRDLGRFDDARNAIADSSVHLHRKWLADVNETERACYRDDSWDCGCEREIAEIEQKNKAAIPIALDRRYHVRDTYSPAHAKVVHLYRCRHCGAMNAMDGTPERQAEYENQRQSHVAAVRTAFLSGVQKGQEIVPPQPDHIILKVQ